MIHIRGRHKKIKALKKLLTKLVSYSTARYRQTVHTNRASVHQAAKLVAALLKVARVTAGLAESNGSLQPGLWFKSPAAWLSRSGINSGTLRSVIDYGLPWPFLFHGGLHDSAAAQHGHSFPWMLKTASKLIFTQNCTSCKSWEKAIPATCRQSWRCKWAHVNAFAARSIYISH